MGTKTDPIADSSKAIGERIKAGRERLGLTQKQFAESVGTSEISVSGWERGLSTPKQPNFGRIAQLIGVTENELRYGAPPVAPESINLPPSHNRTMGRPKLPPRRSETDSK